jgi:hypothetical protein
LHLVSGIKLHEASTERDVMLTQTDTAVLSPLRFLLSAGGVPLLAFGLFFSLWGLWNVVKPQSSRLILSQVVLSTMPGIFAMVAIYVTAADFTELATAETAPKPAIFAAVAGRAMSYGFVGLMSTIVPVLLGATAFRKNCRL